MNRLLGCILLFGSIAGWPPAASAGSFAGGGIYTVLLLDSKFKYLVRIEQPFGFGGPDTIAVPALEGFGSGSFSFDPDPVGAYEFEFQNSTNGTIQGIVVLEISIVPLAGDVPGRSQIELAYSDAGGGGLANEARQTSFLTENGNPQPTFLPALELVLPVTAEGTLFQSAGPVPLPDPESGHFDTMAVQFSFDLEPGDAASFEGSLVLEVPEPAPAALGAAALGSLLAMQRRRMRIGAVPQREGP